MSYRIRIFAVLTGTMVVLVLGWTLWRHASGAEAREAWVAVHDSLQNQKVRIDSLETVVDTMRQRVDEGKRRIDRLGERIAQYERNARRGRLPTPRFEAYERTIERHNEVVSDHNRRVRRLQEIYGRYSRLVDRHNAWIDSANRIRRAAVDEGIQLPRAEPLP